MSILLNIRVVGEADEDKLLEIVAIVVIDVTNILMIKSNNSDEFMVATKFSSFLRYFSIDSNSCSSNGESRRLKFSILFWTFFYHSVTIVGLTNIQY